ncbi:MAG: hypothetical protein O2800_00935 [Planctomycetota bacterium]|nr:hypothetical protein [Planctomycetota bacterium]
MKNHQRNRSPWVLGVAFLGLAIAWPSSVALAQSDSSGLVVPEVPLDKIPEAEREAAKHARTGKFAEFKKLAITRAVAGMKLQAFRKSLRGKEITESDEKEVAKLADAVSKASDRLDGWGEGKKLTAQDTAAMDYINSEIMRAIKTQAQTQG